MPAYFLVWLGFNTFPQLLILKQVQVFESEVHFLDVVKSYIMFPNPMC